MDVCNGRFTRPRYILNKASALYFHWKHLPQDEHRLCATIKDNHRMKSRKSCLEDRPCHTPGKVPRILVPTADQKIVGSGNEDNQCCC